MDRRIYWESREGTKAKRVLSFHTNPLRKSSVSLLQCQELLDLCCASLPTAIEIYVGSKRIGRTRDHAVFSYFALHHEPVHLLNHDGRRKGEREG